MGDCLLDTYVHPDKKITDYVTDISGITFGHIRHAPSTKTVIENVKSILYNKIVVGHTVWKDLEVCGLKEWKGWKAVVDICEFPSFKEKSGKLISLKNLSAKFLGKKIQEGRHSSTEDAQATMNLFLMKKK
jgi:RNA exonuclease 4